MAGQIILFIVGGGLLVAGAEVLIRGASRLAFAVGISPLVVGLTVVAFGTSAPELAVTVGAAWSGQADVALGNVVGSNIFNVLFIMGLAAMISPLVVEQQLVRLDVPLVIGASVAVLLFGLDGRIGRIDGLVLALGIVAYTLFLIRHSREEPAAIASEYDEAFGGPRRTAQHPAVNVALLLVGLLLLVIGARWLVDAAVATATALGVSELVVGLTIVAAGTSLPEVATSVLATVRGERDIAVGNVVGSCLFNLLAVLGIGSALAPGGIPVPDGALTFDLPIMTVVAAAALPVLYTGHRIARWEGVLFLGYYVAYMVYLVFDAADHDLAPQLGVAMIGFVVPLTLVTIAVGAIREVRGRKGAVP